MSVRISSIESCVSFGADVDGDVSNRFDDEPNKQRVVWKFSARKGVDFIEDKKYHIIEIIERELLLARSKGCS